MERSKRKTIRLCFDHIPSPSKSPCEQSYFPQVLLDKALVTGHQIQLPRLKAFLCTHSGEMSAQNVRFYSESKWQMGDSVLGTCTSSRDLCSQNAVIGIKECLKIHICFMMHSQLTELCEWAKQSSVKVNRNLR